MSRHTPHDFEVDYEKYLNLLKKAQGDRQQKIFAANAGVSIAYMNKALSGKYTKPFMPNILRKIASASEGRVSYKDLLTAAGYDYKKHMTYEDAETASIDDIDEFNHWMEISESGLNEENLIEGIVASSLGRKGYKWSGAKYVSYDDRFIFQVNLYDLPCSNWYFISFARRYSTTIGREKNEVLSAEKWAKRILQLVTDDEAKPGEKISFVITDKKNFEIISGLSFPLLGIFISVVLVSFEEFTIIDEKYIETLLKPDQDTPSLT